MKNAVLFIIIFGLGALFYALLSMFFTQVPKESLEDNLDQTPTTTTQSHTEATTTTEETTQDEPEVVITSDGSLLDGPFAIFDADGKQTGATVRILRSPEETLLQFENWNEDHSPASHVYFADDRDASTYFNLGPAKMDEKYYIYGIPLDADLDSYDYILVYQTQVQETEFYAKIR